MEKSEAFFSNCLVNYNTKLHAIQWLPISLNPIPKKNLDFSISSLLGYTFSYVTCIMQARSKYMSLLTCLLLKLLWIAEVLSDCMIQAIISKCCKKSRQLSFEISNRFGHNFSSSPKRTRFWVALDSELLLFFFSNLGRRWWSCGEMDGKHELLLLLL